MKKIALVMVCLLALGSFAFGAEISISGSSTLNWGIKGTIPDGDFADDSATFETESGSDWESAFGGTSWSFSMEAADEDGTVIVSASADSAEYKDTDSPFKKIGSTFGSIAFPNVVKGILGITLKGSDAIGTDYTTQKSKSSDESIVVDVTPVDGLSISVGLVPEFTTITNAHVEGNINKNAVAFNFAAAISGSYKISIGEEDSVTIGLGTVVDTKYFAGQITTVSGAKTTIAYGSVTVADTDPNTTDGITGDWVAGRTSVPFGISVDASVVGLTAGVDFRMVVAEGKDADNVNSVGAAQAWELPMSVGVDVAYDIAVGDMTITPSVDFKFASDYWKWGLKDAAKPADGYEYKGLVEATEFYGRQMSTGVDVAVSGIAGMIDINLGTAFGFGGTSAVKNHGLAYAAGAVNLEKNRLEASTTDNIANLIAMSIEFGVTANVIDGLTITDTVKYTTDGLDATNVNTPALSKITNEFGVEYGLKVGEDVAATFYGDFDLTHENYNVPVAADTGVSTNVNQDGKTTMSYAAGVKVTVSFE